MRFRIERLEPRIAPTGSAFLDFTLLGGTASGGGSVEAHDDPGDAPNGNQIGEHNTVSVRTTPATEVRIRTGD